jgi:hypothetical protein
VGSYQVRVHPHSLDRVRERKVNPHSVDALIQSIPKIKPKIKQFADSQRFWLYSKKFDISLGITIINQDRRILMLKTVIPGHAWADLVPTIEVF